MKIIHVIDSLTQGGAEVLLFNTIKMLPEHQHILVTLVDFVQLDVNSLNLEAHICLGVTDKKSWPRAIVQLRKLIKKHKPDLVHAHLQLAGLIAKLACPRRVPFFYSLHSPYGPDGFSQNRFARLAENFSVKAYHHIIGVSKVVLDDYRQYVSGFGTEDILYNFVPEIFFQHTGTKYQAGSPLACVSVGSLGRAKNYPYTLKQFAAIKDLPISLDIYGEGDALASLSETITKEQLSNVRLQGHKDKIQTILPNYQLYIITSAYEGFGLAPLEAMAETLPVIISDIPAFREVIQDAGMYVDLDKPSDLSDTLKDIYTGRIDLEDFRRRGRDRAMAVATSAHYKQTLLDIYSKYLKVK